VFLPSADPAVHQSVFRFGQLSAFDNDTGEQDDRLPDWHSCSRIIAELAAFLLKGRQWCGMLMLTHC
jgi:hypothetical protein